MDSVKLLHIITEPTRFRILKLLFEHHYCVRALALKMGISESAVSQHIKVLKEQQLVHGEKIGYQMHYQVDRQLLLHAFETVLGAFTPLDSGKSSEAWSCEFSARCIRRDAGRKEENPCGS